MKQNVKKILAFMQRFQKRGIAFFLIFLFFVCLSGFEEGQQKVYDYGSVFTEGEKEQLQELCTKTAKKIKTDIIILTTKEYDGKSPMVYTDDFYDQHEFGYEDYTGFILMFNMVERDIWISNDGDAPDYFTDAMIDEMVEGVGGFLKQDDYMGASRYFISYIEKHMWENDYSQSGLARALKNPVIRMLVAMVIAAVVVLILYSGRKTKLTVSGGTYLEGDKNRVVEKYDRYVRTSTVKRKIESDTNDGSGCSTHQSSGGHTHGGSGGKF